MTEPAWTRPTFTNGQKLRAQDVQHLADGIALSLSLIEGERIRESVQLLVEEFTAEGHTVTGARLVGDDLVLDFADEESQNLGKVRANGIIQGAQEAAARAEAAAATVPNLVGGKLPPETIPASVTDYLPLKPTIPQPVITFSLPPAVAGHPVTALSDEVTFAGYSLPLVWDSTFGRTVTSGASRWDFSFTGDRFTADVYAIGNSGNSKWKLFVDGVPYSDAPFSDSGIVTSIGVQFQMNVRFPDVRKRRITLYTDLIHSTRSLIFPVGTVVSPEPPKTRVAFVGDSFYGGAAGVASIETTPFLVGEGLGVHAANFGLGGSGYVASATPFGSTSRVAKVTAYQPDLIVISGSVNDDPSAATVGAAATAAYAAYRAALPTVPIIVFGPQPNNHTTTLTANRTAVNAATRAAAEAAPNVIAYIDMIGTASGTIPPAYSSATTYSAGMTVSYNGSVWRVPTDFVGTFSNQAPGSLRWELVTWLYTGTGKLGSVTGDGTRDILLDADGVHPTLAGQKAFAAQQGAVIRKLMPKVERYQLARLDSGGKIPDSALADRLAATRMSSTRRVGAYLGLPDLGEVSVVMDTPPTVTVSGPSTVSPRTGSPTVLPHSTSQVTKRRGRYSAQSINSVAYQQNYINNPSTSRSMGEVAFTFTGLGFDIKWQNGNNLSAGTRVWVDGQLVRDAHYAAPADGTTQQPYWTTVTFATRAARQVVIELVGGAMFGGLSFDAADSVTPIVDRKPRVPIYGDSWAAGALGVLDKDLIWYRLGLELGWETARLGAGGTGYARGTNPYEDAARLAELTGFRGDLAVLLGSINNDTTDPETVRTTAAAVYAQIATASPQARLIIVGPQFYLPGISPAARLAVRDAVKAAAEAAPNVVAFIDPIAGDWINLGNYLTYMINEAGTYAHLNTAGHRYYANQLARAILSVG